MIHIDSPRIDFILKDITSVTKVSIEKNYSGSHHVSFTINMKGLSVCFGVSYWLSEEIEKATDNLNKLRNFLLTFMLDEHQDKHVKRKITIDKDFTYTIKYK